MNKIFATISSLLIAMGIKGQVPVKKETSKIPISHADTISPKKVYPKVESKMANESKVYPKIDTKAAKDSKVYPKVEHKVTESKVEHKIAESKIAESK
nr:hypothetical protein [Chitinophagaceae bacterium]